MKIENILVILDQQDKDQMALSHAKVMAQRYEAKLHIVAFHYEHLGSMPPGLSDEQHAKVKDKILLAGGKWLDSQLAKQDLAGQTSSEVVWEKNIASWVKQHCTSKSYDLIIKTGHRSDRPFYVPTDWHLLRNNLVPVLLVAEKKWRKKQSIMLTLDMATGVKTKQALNQKLVDAGLTLTARTGMALHICFNIAISPVLRDLGIVDSKIAIRDARSKYVPLIQEMLGEHQVPVDHIHIKAGAASKVIPSVASKIGAGLVIIGSVGRKGVRAKLMGNTAEDVLALLKTDILVMQP